MLKIRLRRMGSRHRPFYRVVVSDSRQTPTARALEEIGYYDPRKKPAMLSIDVDRVEHWVSQGAKPSSTVRRLVSQARSNAAAAPVVEAPPAEAPPAKAPPTETPPAEEKSAKADDEPKADEPEPEKADDDEPKADEPEPEKADDAEPADAEPKADDDDEPEKT